VARYSIPKQCGRAALSGGMATVGLALAGGRSGAVDAALVASSVVFALMFGFIAAVHIRRVFDRREQVVIDARGLYVRAHGETRIALRSIKGIAQEMGRLSLTLHKPSKYPIETRRRRMIYRLNGPLAKGFFGDVWIWTNQLDQPPAAFVDAIRAHRVLTAFEKDLEERIAASR
jgi:hypothetical protein